jgi:hypothetical protein
MVDYSQVQLRFAVRGEGLVHINAFDDYRGLTKDRPTDLTCPECEERVIPVLSPARQITDHFRHHSDTGCRISANGESVLHFNAKAVLAQELNKFHSASLVYQCEICQHWYSFLKIEHYDCAKVELKAANRRRPDVSCVSGAEVVGAAEIFHTHAVDFEKKADFSRAGFPWFEIPALNVHRQHFKFVEAAHIFSIDAVGAGITYPIAPRVCEVCAPKVARRAKRLEEMAARQLQEFAKTASREEYEERQRAERKNLARARRASDWKQFKRSLPFNSIESVLAASVDAEHIIPEIDQYGIRLTPKMSGDLYIAVANYRRANFERTKRMVAAIEE